LARIKVVSGWLERLNDKNSAHGHNSPDCRESTVNCVKQHYQNFTFEDDGVDDGNREQWKQTILAKNPWLPPIMFKAEKK